MNWLSKVSVDLRSRSYMIKRQMAKKKTIYMLAAFLVLTACTTRTTIIGSDFDYSKGDLIVKGQTTKQEIMQMVGQPFDKTLDESGAEKWIYLYEVKKIRTSGGGFRGPRHEGTITTKKIEIIFDQDVVKNSVASQIVKPYSSR